MKKGSEKKEIRREEGNEYCVGPRSFEGHKSQEEREISPDEVTQNEIAENEIIPNEIAQNVPLAIGRPNLRLGYR